MHYVVTETLYEYNDEYHTVVDGNGGNPVAVYTNEEDAKREVMRRTINDFFRGWGIEMIAGWIWGYGIQSTFSRTPSFLADKEDEFWDANYETIHDILDLKNRSDEELEDLAECLEYEPFTYTAVA